MQYNLFVFAGQSNMMGACVLPPKHLLSVKCCLEYRYNPVHRGNANGSFVPVSYDTGEFLYHDPKAAYQNTDETGKSRLCDYEKNTYFVSALSNLDSREEKTVKPFSAYSESERNPAASLVPYFCEEWERLGETALVAHIAKGGVSADHFFSKEMIAEYNQFAASNGFSPLSGTGDAEEIYCRKCQAFFRDAEKAYPNACGKRVLVWNQGESDSQNSCKEYQKKLSLIWEKAQKIGFDLFLIIRTGYWFTHDTCHVMQAQEEFCKETPNAYIITRGISFMPDPHFMENPEDFYIREPAPEYSFCRDSFYGYQNSHINEKGFILAAKAAARNTYQILKEQKQPLLEEDIVRY